MTLEIFGRKNETANLHLPEAAAIRYRHCLVGWLGLVVGLKFHRKIEIPKKHSLERRLDIPASQWYDSFKTFIYYIICVENLKYLKQLLHRFETVTHLRKNQPPYQDTQECAASASEVRRGWWSLGASEVTSSTSPRFSTPKITGGCPAWTQTRAAFKSQRMRQNPATNRQKHLKK